MTKFFAGLLVYVLLATQLLPVVGGLNEPSAQTLTTTSPLASQAPAATAAPLLTTPVPNATQLPLPLADPTTKEGWLALIEATKSAPLAEQIRTLDLTGQAARYGDWYPGWPLLTAAPGETLVVRGGKFGRVGLGGGDIVFAGCDFSFDGGTRVPSAALYYNADKDVAARLRLTLEQDTRVALLAAAPESYNEKSAAVLVCGQAYSNADIAVFNHGEITSNTIGIFGSVYTSNAQPYIYPVHLQQQIQNSGTIIAGETGVRTDNTLYRGSVFSRVENSGRIESQGLGLLIRTEVREYSTYEDCSIDVVAANTGSIRVEPRWGDTSDGISVISHSGYGRSSALCYNGGIIDAFNRGIRVDLSRNNQPDASCPARDAATVIHEGAMFHTQNDLWLNTPMGADIAFLGSGTGPLGKLRGVWEIESDLDITYEEIIHEANQLDQQLRLRGLPPGVQMNLCFTHFDWDTGNDTDLGSVTLFTE